MRDDGAVSLRSLTQHFFLVISPQLPRRGATRDLPGSLSKCLKDEIDGTVCLPYIPPPAGKLVLLAAR